ncbi:Dipeptidyl peptidase 3 [Araneus ventricosus]|uniref:Dipeptidyl peptidase 3 n=1 Tax=Araneus ventricosus TaxID=182803 RepID=A0A4Y2NAQ2_ARAVE|nr:Dipeptidyl peptidase 3 [Araneus ventricosus]
MYDPKTGSWLQAHGQAAYVILQVLLKCEGNFVKVEKIKGEDGNPDLLFTMDRNKILSHGKPCIGEFLKKLQLYKSTADIASAKAMFDMYSAVTSEERYPFLEYREIVLARKKPRRILVQANTFLDEDKVILKNYESSPEGLIQSYVERYPDGSIHTILEELWEKDTCHFT